MLTYSFNSQHPRVKNLPKELLSGQIGPRTKKKTHTHTKQKTQKKQKQQNNTKNSKNGNNCNNSNNKINSNGNNNNIIIIT